jgi:hypothetical protein
MALPSPTRPEYNTTIPSTGKKIKYQPFTVKEEKILVLAAEGKETDEIGNAVANCLRNCITSPADLDIESLALFDIEYLFLKCRAKSIGEKITVRATDPDDETFIKTVDINIDKIQVQRNEKHNEIVQIDEEMSVKLNYPNIDFFTEGLELTDVSSITTVIAKCFSQLIVGEEVYNKDDLSEEEIIEWIEQLSSSQYNKLTEFFLTMPKLSHKLTIKNTKTDKNFTITLEGLADFF